MVTFFLLRLFRLARLGSRRRGLGHQCRDLEVFELPCGLAGQLGSELERVCLRVASGDRVNRPR